VRAAASARVRVLFSDPSIVGQQQSDQYHVDGNILCAFLEEADAMLRPLLAEHRSIYIKLWDFMRCATVACKTMSTLEREGFAQRLDAYPACIERFVQWIFHFAPNLYVERPYLALARYVWFLQAKQMWTLHSIPMAWASLQAAESRNGKVRGSLAQQGGVTNQHMSEERLDDNKFHQALTAHYTDYLIGARVPKVVRDLGLLPVSQYVAPCPECGNRTPPLHKGKNCPRKKKSWDDLFTCPELLAGADLVYREMSSQSDVTVPAPPLRSCSTQVDDVLQCTV
jgi:hypothetical protein